MCPGWTHVPGLDKRDGGAARGIRTPDPRITNAVLYRLSYCGVKCASLIPGVGRIGKQGG